MNFRGGMVNGTLAALYGAASYYCLFLRQMDHEAMTLVCYTLAVAGLLLAIYWFATREIMAIPLVFMSVLHGLLGFKAPHESMIVGCTGLAVISFVIGIMMLAKVRAPGEPGM